MVRRSAGKNAWAGFVKVDPLTDESLQMSLTLDRRAFSFYDVGKHDWSAEPGDFSILVGSLSAETNLKGKFLLTNGQETR